MKQYRILFFSILVLTFSSCTSASFVKTGTAELQSRRKNCTFSVLTAIPNKQYEEVGLIEYSSIGPNSYGPSSLERAKNLAEEYVCESGGNAILLWQANGKGEYLKATILNIKQ